MIIIENIQIWQILTIVPKEMLSWKNQIESYFSKMTLFVKSIWYLPLSKRKKHVGRWWDELIQTHGDTSYKTETCEMRRSGEQKKKIKTKSKTIKCVRSLKVSTKLCLKVKVKEKKESEKRRFRWSPPSWTPEKQVEVKRCFWRKIFKEKTIRYWSIHHWLTAPLSLPFFPIWNQSKVHISKYLVWSKYFNF